MFFSIMGPGMVTAFADNDAGGVTTCATAGAKYGYALLFTMFASTVALAIAQEISARTGAVTGKGLADLIREQFGVKWAFFAMLVLFIANLGTTVTEFSGIATSFEIFGVSKYLSVPIAAILVWWLVLKTDYRQAERLFLLLCLTFFSYILSCLIINPPWGEILRAAVKPTLQPNSDFLLMAVGIIGTTITPWGQFYVQASVVDKGIGARDYAYTRWDVLIGSCVTGLISFFIIVATAATLFANQIPMETAKDAAIALVPLAGPHAALLFAFGLLGASVLAAFILPLSTSYAFCEAFGFERGLNKTYKEAPVFFGLYTFIIALSACLVLWPNLSLYRVILTTQAVNGVLLPPVLIFMVLLASDRRLMGRYVNSRWYNAVAWLFTIVLIALTVMLLVTNLPGSPLA